ncbi:MAG: LytTR family transcriptional regulator [Marinilabiliales bacterium]|nr:MAG: LytTR family transcriptional regulator [Marinilabiliales bacterium]
MRYDSETLIVKTTAGNRSIKLKDIFYIKGCEKRACIYFTEDKMIKVHHMLSWFETILNCGSFCRCHRSFIVNLNWVEHHSACRFLLKGNIKIPISRLKRDQVKKVFSEYPINE